MSFFSQTSGRPLVNGVFYLVSFWCTAELFQHHLYDWVGASGPSMYPTLPSHSTPAIINHRYRYGRGCKIGDIIQFSNPVFTNEMAAKRILGMPGDYVVIDEDRRASVGGAKGPWMGGEEIGKHREEPRMIQVPEGNVWVVGDNLAYSRDSRFFGPLPMGLIAGKLDYHVQKLFGWTSFRGDNLAAVPMEEVD